MLAIRLTRTGSKKRPFYHIVAADSRRARDGRYIERLGYFNPIARGKELRLQLDMERVTVRQQQGAQISDRVRALLKEYENPENGKLAKKEAKKTNKLAAAEKAEAEKVAAEKAEAEKVEAEKAEAEKAEVKKADAEEQTAGDN